MTPRELLSAPRETIKVRQNTDEWLQLRRSKRTASETPAVLGLSPWTSPIELAMAKFSSEPANNNGNIAMSHGHKFEPIARKLYERSHDLKMTPCVLARGDYLASLDGLSGDEKTVLEIKCPFTKRQSGTWQHAEHGVVERHYYAQIQHQLMVSGAKRCHLWVFDSDTKEALLVPVLPCIAFHIKIINAWDLFWQRYT
jgi:putative phage-type endonuclease